MFYNFDNNGEITPSLSCKSFACSSEYARNLLYKETEKQGLRNVDLSILTGWGPSKVSKITAGKQKLTADDIKTWSRALGYTPDPFVNMSVDLRDYNCRVYLRNVSASLEDYFEKYQDDLPEHSAIVDYELPLSILSTLGVTVSDYAVRASASSFSVNPFNNNLVGGNTNIRFYHRATAVKGELTPEFGLWIAPENDYFLMMVYLNSNMTEEGITRSQREKYKDILQVDEELTNQFEEFADKHDWIPNGLKKGEIVSIGADTNCLPGPGDMENVLVRLFKDYCRLVWEVKGIDLLPDVYKMKERENLDPVQAFHIINNNGDFDYETKKTVLEREDYKCENNPEHQSFLDDSERPYMDVVPIVPFMAGVQFGQSILSADNGVCLCPMCKAQLLHGALNDREDMVFKLYRKHQKSLKESGIDLSLTQVLAANGLV